MFVLAGGLQLVLLPPSGHKHPALTSVLCSIRRPKLSGPPDAASSYDGFVKKTNEQKRTSQELVRGRSSGNESPSRIPGR